MEHVAQRAGVSLMTVSRALREPSLVAQPTRDRIQDAITELGYVGSAFAVQLASGRTRLVAVLLPDLRNPAFAVEMQGLAEGLGEGLELIVSGVRGSGTRHDQVARALLGYKPAALVIHGGRHSHEMRELLVRSNVPIVELGSLVARPINIAVGYSNRAAGRVATEHLLQRGYRTIGFVSQSRKDNSRADDRWLGFREALRAAGITPRPELELETSLGYERGAEALKELLCREPKIDAVFFTGDGWALGALFYCQRENISVPGRVAIMGFDDQELASQTVPSLTSIQVPRYRMGWEAGTLLRSQLDGKAPERKRIDLGFKLVHRQTT
ncbi:LacI family DNA-binding transcriptional regulator [Bordetella sp. BOR01]|uniref:LacI family DNA-binding transcriptional regulator n=1 Tax=Bordetella sp. BOR01 TaxID=2854779 RepID=UPI001C4720B6|nr:LacI family DNA-binding transcriptional regulator [Bordetella sp. BOR01]MBV7484623.1 LacI family DNA-binding transcriptional regulator [Bordetella sp. BOR01]